jgi:hypothetical protein
MANKGMVSGDQQVPLKQRPTTNELLVQLTNAGVQIDPSNPIVTLIAIQLEKFDQILIELRKLNSHMALINDKVITEEDILIDMEDNDE